MVPSNNVIIIGPAPLKMLGLVALTTMVGAMGVAAVLLGLFGLDWLLVSGWISVLITAACFACLGVAPLLVAIVGRRPRLEIGPDGFVSRTLFGSRFRRWSDINGPFVVIKIG